MTPQCLEHRPTPNIHKTTILFDDDDGVPHYSYNNNINIASGLIVRDDERMTPTRNDCGDSEYSSDSILTLDDALMPLMVGWRFRGATVVGCSIRMLVGLDRRWVVVGGLGRRACVNQYPINIRIGTYHVKGNMREKGGRHWIKENLQVRLFHWCSPGLVNWFCLFCGEYNI